MKLLLLSTMLLLASIVAVADINSINMPTTMLHPSKASMGLGCSGQIQYSLTPGTYDSVFVTLTITPQAGGAPLTLSEVSGDVGNVAVNVNTPNVAQTFTIFFQLADLPQVGSNYVAHISANAVVSNTQVDINTKLAALSSANKASLCGLVDKFTSSSITGSTPIPPIYMNDGPYGWNTGWGNNTDHATCFPACVNEASTWDTALARLQGKTKAEEWRAEGKNCSLGPGMTLIYHPLCGRSAEYMSEDPYLSGRIAAADALGLQDNGVMATIKHFACNSVELNRRDGQNSVAADERTLQEIFLYNWKQAAKVTWAMMASYNMIDGMQACSNAYTLSNLLRNHWGYRSMVMSDWGAAWTGMAINYGIDMGCNYQPPYDDGFSTYLVSASDSLINMHFGRILYAHEKIGDLKPGYSATAFAGSVESAAHKTIVRTIGTNSIILARNTGNILPLPKTGKTIAILSGSNSTFGPFATVCQPGISGSGNVYPTVMVSYVQGIAAQLTGVGAGASTIIQNPTSAQLNSADYILVFVGVSAETEGTDRTSVALGGSEGETVAATALAATNGANKTIVVYTGGNSSIAGNWSNAPAIVIAHFPGDQQGLSLADILFGNFNPCGKLSATFFANNAQLPPYENNLILPYSGSDTAHGYFRVNKLGQTPLFAFGYGMSYTTFAYSSLQIYPTSITAGDRVQIQVTVQNLGTNPAGTPDTASEIVQLYLSMPSTNPTLPVRVQDLRGFRKITLSKGASTIVNFTLTAEDMQVFNPNGDNYPNVNGYNDLGKWQVLSGTYGVRVGTSSEQTRQPTVSGSFTVQ
jgi:beta-glucosidase